jgi:hypothetical protein
MLKGEKCLDSECRRSSNPAMAFAKINASAIAGYYGHSQCVTVSKEIGFTS